MKKVDVFTYSDPTRWEQHSQFDNMKTALHICATTNMKRGIQQRYEELSNIYTIRDVLTTFRPFNNWYNAEKQLAQYLQFSKHITHFQYETATLLAAFKANKEQLFHTIRFLVQADIEPSDLPADHQLAANERVFKQLWYSYEQQNVTFKAHRRLLNSKGYASVFAEDFDLHGKPYRIYLHGFYFITPEQQLFFKFLQRNGFELIFFQYYDSRFANTFDFIRLFIDESYGWSSDWQMEPSQNELPPIAHDFLMSYEKRKAKKIESHIGITKYNTFFDFLQGVIIPYYPIGEAVSINRDVKIFAPNAEEFNDLIQLYYPTLDKDNRNFLAHPIGRFLVNIHQLWKNETLILSGELLLELFASGWLIDEKTGEQAINYTYDLQQILPYFTDCEMIDEWELRIKQLADVKQTLQQTFQSKTKERQDEQLRNPFTKLSYLKVEQERIAQIKDFIEGIRLLAEDLFDTVRTTTMTTHFSKLLTMLKRRRKADTFTDQIERELLDTLIQRLNKISDSAEFLYEDIQPALYLYLSGRFNDRKENVMTDFLELDGEIFKEQPTPIYLTALDEKNLPLHGKPNPWPLQTATMNHLANHSVAIELFLNRNATVKETSRFLFFIALSFLQNGQLQLSWIANRLTHEDLNSALYARQLNLIEKPFRFRTVQEETVTTIIQQVLPTEQEKRAFFDSVNKTEMLAEFELCQKRFYYSYIVQDYAAFDEDFMHEFIFSNVYRIAAGTSNGNIERVTNDLQPFFPQFKRYRLLATANDSHQFKYQFNNNPLLKSRMTVNHLLPGLTKDHRDKLLTAVTDQTMRDILQDEQIFKSNAASHCKFCPHKGYCLDVQYGIDDLKR